MIYMLFYLLLSGFSLIGQEIVFKPVTSQIEMTAFKDAIAMETAKMSDIKANFIQTKKMEFLNEAIVSTGMLYFAEGKRLRWEYEKPYSFSFILNGAKAWMVNQNAVTELNVNSNKMLKEISELMMFGMGGASLFENRNFDFSFRSSEKLWEVILKPKSKEMKALYSQVVLTFSMPSCIMESVRMVETSGDETLIQLKNQKINTKLSDALFEGKK